jgi:hypothetical protein
LDKQLWFPDWGEVRAASMPVLKGRTVYAGAEYSF